MSSSHYQMHLLYTRFTRKVPVNAFAREVKSGQGYLCSYGID
jgi:hypothetical protein